MKKLAILIAALALSGCAVKPLQMNERVAIIQHGDAQPQFNDALIAATQHCAKYGKVATMSAQTCPGQCVTQFRCE